MEEANTLKGYVCPCCRLLISARVGDLGEDVSCPGCSSRIHIPELEASPAVVKPNTQSLSTYAHLRVKQHASIDNWRIELPVEYLSARAAGLPWAMLLPAFAIGIGLVFGLIAVLVQTDTAVVAQSPIKEAENVQELDPNTAASKAPTTAEVEALLAKMSQAKSVSELVLLVRQVPRIQEKLTQTYQGKKLSYGEVKRVDEVKPITTKKGVFLFRAAFADGKRRAGVVSLGANGSWVIDWESYEGYCEIEWDEIPKAQPKKSTLVRAIRTRAEYYNQGFHSDEWQSFELSYPDTQTVLIGYARRSGTLIHQLLPIGNQVGPMDVTLKIRYPDTVGDPRLVIIDEFVSGDWVEMHEQ